MNFFVLNVGDSRTYWFDRDRKFVTTDHTLAELELRAGHLTKEQAKKRPCKKAKKQMENSLIL